MNYFFDAFKEALKLMISMDLELYSIIALSLCVSFTALIGASILGLPIGAILGLKEFKGKFIIINIINTFMGIPPVVVGLLVYILLSNQSGVWGDLRLLFTPIAMIIAQFFLALPLIIGLTYSAVKNVNPMVKKTTVTLGASKILSAFTVIKEARFSIYTAFIVVFGRLLAEVGAVMMVGGNIRYQTRVMTTAIAMQKGMGEFQTALALGIILLILSFIINAAVEVLRNKEEL